MLTIGQTTWKVFILKRQLLIWIKHNPEIYSNAWLDAHIKHCEKTITKRNMINVCEEGGHKCHICEKIWMNECLFIQTNMVKHSKNIQEGDNLNCECLICVKALSCISELWEDVKRCHKVNLSKTKETDQWKRDSIPSIFVDKKKKYVALFDLWKPSLSVNYSGQN